MQYLHFPTPKSAKIREKDIIPGERYRPNQSELDKNPTPVDPTNVWVTVYLYQQTMLFFLKYRFLILWKIDDLISHLMSV